MSGLCCQRVRLRAPKVKNTKNKITNTTLKPVNKLTGKSMKPFAVGRLSSWFINKQAAIMYDKQKDNAAIAFMRFQQQGSF